MEVKEKVKLQYIVKFDYKYKLLHFEDALHREGNFKLDEFESIVIKYNDRKSITLIKDDDVLVEAKSDVRVEEIGYDEMFNLKLKFQKKNVYTADFTIHEVEKVIINTSKSEISLKF